MEPLFVIKRINSSLSVDILGYATNRKDRDDILKELNSTKVESSPRSNKIVYPLYASEEMHRIRKASDVGKTGITKTPMF